MPFIPADQVAELITNGLDHLPPALHGVADQIVSVLGNVADWADDLFEGIQGE